MSRKIFVNIAVKDLEKSKVFYTGLGFSNNPQFTDATAASMVISDDIYVMLLTQEKFESFSPHPISDPNKQTEVLLCISCDSREEVDTLAKRALTHGGTIYREPMDYGFMYGHSFKDPDGHAWELAYMDPAAMPG